MTPYAIPNNSYLVSNALKGAEGPPDLLCRHLFEPGAGCVGGIQKSSLQVWPCTIGKLCCKFQVPRSKTAEPFDTVFFDTDTILILPRSENSILILYWYFPGPGTSILILYRYFYGLKLRYRYDTDTQHKMLDTKGDTIIIAKNILSQNSPF